MVDRLADALTAQATESAADRQPRGEVDRLVAKFQSGRYERLDWMTLWPIQTVMIEGVLSQRNATRILLALELFVGGPGPRSG